MVNVQNTSGNKALKFFLYGMAVSAVLVVGQLVFSAKAFAISVCGDGIVLGSATSTGVICANADYNLIYLSRSANGGLCSDNTTYCELNSTCVAAGKGTCNPTEKCDDGGLCTGNNSTKCAKDADCVSVGGACTPRSGDGCSSSCQIELGYGCANTTHQMSIGTNADGDDFCVPVVLTDSCVASQVPTLTINKEVGTKTITNLTNTSLTPVVTCTPTTAPSTGSIRDGNFQLGATTCDCPGFIWLGGTTCSDINACTNNPCLSGYTCADKPAPALDEASGRTCTDINECLANSGKGDCAQTCTNTPEGSYTCSCGIGYMLNADGKTCDNVNECVERNGGCAQVCSDSTGSYACSCNAGYTLNADGKTCDNINECVVVTQVCTSWDSNYSYYDDSIDCYIWDTVTGPSPVCNLNPNTSCIDTVGSFSCDCNTGYHKVGSDCVLDQVCGNSAVEGTETCDEGAKNGKPTHCNSGCTGTVPGPSTLKITGSATVNIGEPQNYTVTAVDSSATPTSYSFDATKVDVNVEVNGVSTPSALAGVGFTGASTATATSATFSFTPEYRLASAGFSTLKVKYLNDPDLTLAETAKDVTVVCAAGVKTYSMSSDALNAALDAYDLSKNGTSYTPTTQELKDYDFDCDAKIDLNDALNIYDVSKAM